MNRRKKIVKKNNKEYNILFLIPSNDDMEFIKILVNNILKFNNNCVVAIHLNINKPYKNLNIKDVYFTKTRINSLFLKCLTPLMILNQEFNNLKYKYVCLLASNSFFFKDNLYDYIKDYDYGCYNQFVKKDNFNDKFEDCYNFAKSLKANITYSGQFEGSFYKKELFNLISDKLIQFCPIDKMNYLQDTTEECFLPTAANILLKDYKRANPICFIKIRYGGFDNRDDINYNYEEVVNLIKNLKQRKIKKIKYALKEEQENNFYTYKRVSRNLNDKLLNYFKNL